MAGLGNAVGPRISSALVLVIVRLDQTSDPFDASVGEANDEAAVGGEVDAEAEGNTMTRRAFQRPLSAEWRDIGRGWSVYRRFR